MAAEPTQKPIVAGLTVAWKRCTLCQQKGHLKATSFVFKSPREFCGHLREYHCTKEGGSYVCRYGPNGVCPSLPVDGVSDQDYEDHVARDHVAGGDPGRLERYHNYFGYYELITNWTYCIIHVIQFQ